MCVVCLCVLVCARGSSWLIDGSSVICVSCRHQPPVRPTLIRHKRACASSDGRGRAPLQVGKLETAVDHAVYRSNLEANAHRAVENIHKKFVGSGNIISGSGERR